MFQSAEILLRLDDGVEVAAIGDIGLQAPHAGNIGLQPGGVHIGWHVGDAHPIDVGAVLAVFRHHNASRSVETQRAGSFRLHKSALDRRRYRSDRAVTAHGQAAGRLDEQNRDVAIIARRRQQ